MQLHGLGCNYPNQSRARTRCCSAPAIAICKCIRALPPGSNPLPCSRCTERERSRRDRGHPDSPMFSFFCRLLHFECHDSLVSDRVVIPDSNRLHACTSHATCSISSALRFGSSQYRMHCSQQHLHRIFHQEKLELAVNFMNYRYPRRQRYRGN